MNPATPSPFLTEVAEHPLVLRELTAWYRGPGRERLAAWAELAHRHRRVVFTGMGTSEFAPDLILQRLACAGVDATTLDAGELLHYPRPLQGLLVGISQSGESIETRTVAEGLHARMPLVAIVNHTESALARLSALVLPMHAGAEAAISTKTYANTLALLHLLASAVEAPGGIEPALAQLEALAGTMPRVDAGAIGRAAEVLAETGVVHMVARGPAMAAARQAALTFMEGTRSSCTAFSGGAFRHGPFELVGPSHRALFFAPAGAGGDRIVAMAREAASHGSGVVLITDRAEVEAVGRMVVLPVPAHGEALFPLAAAPTQELLLDAVARRRGVEAGRFRFGGKVTVRE